MRGILAAGMTTVMRSTEACGHFLAAWRPREIRLFAWLLHGEVRAHATLSRRLVELAGAGRGLQPRWERCETHSVRFDSETSLQALTWC